MEKKCIFCYNGRSLPTTGKYIIESLLRMARASDRIDNKNVFPVALSKTLSNTNNNNNIEVHAEGKTGRN